MIGSTLTLNARNRTWTFLELKYFSMRLALVKVDSASLLMKNVANQKWIYNTYS